MLGAACCFFAKDFLAVRGLSVVLLMAAFVMCEKARWHDSLWRDAITGWAYVWVLAALWLSVQPWRLRDWIGWGLDGLEIYYSQYTPEDAAWTLAMTGKYNLLGSGGSDFHGISKPDVHLGKAHTGEAVPAEVLQQLKARRERNAATLKK